MVFDGTTLTAAAVTSLDGLIGGFASANYGQLSGGDTTKAVQFQTLGTDTNVSLALQSKGTGGIDLASGSTGVNISNGGTVTALTRTASGTGYTSSPTITISPPTTAGGVQATATCVLGNTGAIVVANGGTGYSLSDVLTLVGGTYSTAGTITVTGVSGGVITSVSAASVTGYTVAPVNPISVTGGTGSGATFTITWAVSSAITITNAGSGYVEQPTVSFSGGGGSGAAAYATVGSGVSLKTLGGTLTFNGSSGDVFRIYDYGGQAGIGVRGHILSGTAPVIFPTPSNSGQTNITLQLASLGTGSINFSTGGILSASGVFNQIDQLRVAHTASAVNYLQVAGSSSGNTPTLSAQGSDANIGVVITAKGSGSLSFYTQNRTYTQFRIIDSNAVNFLQVQGNVAGGAPVLSTQGTDTNVSMALQSKGTGGIDLAAGSTGINISNGTTVTAVIRTAAGTGFTSPPTWTAAAPTTAGGVTASGSVNSIGVVTATVSAGGSGYVVGDVLTVSGGTQTTVATLTVATLSGSAVATVSISNAGVYTAAPTNPAATTGGTGTGATFTLSFGINNSFTISTAGSGYVEQPAVTFSGGGGSSATANGLIGSTAIVRFLADATFYSASGPQLALVDTSNQGTNAYLQLGNGASSSVNFRALGSATNIGYFYTSKGNGSHAFTTQNVTSAIQFQITNTTSAVNNLTATGATTTNSPVISAVGSDTNISINLTPKGTGSIVATAPVRLQGYTVATLPTAGTAGRTAYVTDATAPTYLGTLTGGGAVRTPVFDNGTAWVSY
jgi:hypothetical protein